MTTKDLIPRLDVILAAKRQSLLDRKAKTPIEAVRALASMQKRPQPVLSMVTRNAPVMLLGQIRYRVAQTGSLAESYDPVSSGLRFVQNGVDGISLFTDETLYQRGLDDLVLVSRAVGVPVISQDYIFDEYQIVEARAAGASAVVLHAGVVDHPTLRTLVSATHRNRMTAIVQAADEEEVGYALSLSPYVIGLSPVNPVTGEMDVDYIHRLRRLIPGSIHVLVTDGLRHRDDVAAIISLNVDAVLIRESVLDTPDQMFAITRILKRFNADRSQNP